MVTFNYWQAKTLSNKLSSRCQEHTLMPYSNLTAQRDCRKLLAVHVHVIFSLNPVSKKFILQDIQTCQ